MTIAIVMTLQTSYLVPASFLQLSLLPWGVGPPQKKYRLSEIV